MSPQESETLIDLLARSLALEHDTYESGLTDEERENRIDDPDHWNTAVRWARRLLRASGRDDWSGCPLCRS